ncbi:MAG: hypothetical protein AAFZ49_01160, partial [Cyanobacteria bacterium J06659_2]
SELSRFPGLELTRWDASLQGMNRLSGIEQEPSVQGIVTVLIAISWQGLTGTSQTFLCRLKFSSILGVTFRSHKSPQESDNPARNGKRRQLTLRTL